MLRRAQPKQPDAAERTESQSRLGADAARPEPLDAGADARALRRKSAAVKQRVTMTKQPELPEAVRRFVVLDAV